MKKVFAVVDSLLFRGSHLTRRLVSIVFTAFVTLLNAAVFTQLLAVLCTA